MKRVAVGVFLCSSLLWAGSSKDSSELVITNVNVVDTRYGGIEPNATVIVKDGVIEAVAKFALINAGPQVRVINAEGRYLIPGLWDMDVHLLAQANSTSTRNALFARYLASGVTGLRDMDSMNRTATDTEFRPEIEPAEPFWSLQKTSSRGLSLFERRTVEGLAEIRAHCLGVSAEVADPTQECDPSRARDLFLTLSETATWMVPDLISGVMRPEGSRPAADTSPDDVPLTPAKTALLSHEKELKVPTETQRDLDLVSEMRRTGVQFLAGTNGPTGGLTPGLSLHQELELLVMGGFTPLQALQAATFNPALYMARLDKYGVVEHGHYGDLVLLEENPLVDIRNTRKIFAMVIRGKYFSAAEMQDVLEQAEENAGGEVSAAKPAAPRSAQ